MEHAPPPELEEPSERARSVASVDGAPRTPQELAIRKQSLCDEFGELITLDGLTRDFKIFQRRRGHRHSTDDLLTAWYAIKNANAPVTQLLDLGSGIGSVGLAVAWHFRTAHLTAVEVQGVSYLLLGQNVWANGVDRRATTIHGDLREAVPEGAWDLITGSPPYFDVRAGIVSADPQRAGARFELCGDVRDYCRIARSRLRPEGRFVFCFPTEQRERAEKACAAANLAIVRSRDVVPKAGLPALFSLFACARDDDRETAAQTLEPPFVVRDESGRHTAEHTAARALFGMGV